jgi:hypothetical protein
MILFDSIEDFAEEMKKDAGEIEHDVLRLTTVRQRLSASSSALFVVATYRWHGETVEYRGYMGDLWEIGEGLEPDRTTLSRCWETQNRLKTTARRLNLEVRAGRYGGKG